MWPFSWGLTGTAREIARANYELTGIERDLRILELHRTNVHMSDKEYQEGVLAIQKKHGAITGEDYRRGIAMLIDDETARKLALLEIDLETGKVSETEYEKASATIKGEPWVAVLRMDFGTTSALEGSFELDWNDEFVDKLQSEGYTGPIPDHIVNTWFMEVCKNVATEEFDGTGTFQADAEHNLETMRRWQSVGEGRSSYR